MVAAKKQTAKAAKKQAAKVAKRASANLVLWAPDEFIGLVPEATPRVPDR